MMPMLRVIPQFPTNKLNARVKSITPKEKDIIKNVFGNDSTIPQIIYNRIQSNLNKGKYTNAMLKIKLGDGTSHWTNNRFEPSTKNNFKDRFTVKTELANTEQVIKTEALYSKLIKIEQHISVTQADKYLVGYLEEKCISFNELTTF